MCVFLGHAVAASCVGVCDAGASLQHLSVCALMFWHAVAAFCVGVCDSGALFLDQCIMDIDLLTLSSQARKLGN